MSCINSFRSLLLELPVQCTWVAMTTAPQKVCWIIYYKKLYCFSDASSLHVGKSPPAISSFLPSLIENSVHTRVQRAMPALPSATMSPLSLTRRGIRIKNTILQHFPHIATTQGRDLMPRSNAGREKRVSKDIWLDLGCYRTILHKNPGTCKNQLANFNQVLSEVRSLTETFFP